MSPNEDKCVHCLPQGDGKLAYARREAVRRCAEVVGLGVVGLDSYIGIYEYSFGEDRGEVFLTASKEPALKLGPQSSVEPTLGRGAVLVLRRV